MENKTTQWILDNYDITRKQLINLVYGKSIEKYDADKRKNGQRSSAHIGFTKPILICNVHYKRLNKNKVGSPKLFTEKGIKLIASMYPKIENVES